MLMKFIVNFLTNKKIRDEMRELCIEIGAIKAINDISDRILDVNKKYIIEDINTKNLSIYMVEIAKILDEVYREMVDKD